uniref:SRCR domain-containing protein n=1 Tax=Anas platyrhynchos TaxID=8839 RepID=A0A8B9T1S3_ANAPL
AEAALWDCPAKAWGQHNCRHKEDAGVICSGLLENSDGCSGRLQVFYNGTWGSVCSNSMTTETVSLVCKELGCGNEGDLETDSNYAKLSGTAWLDYVECGKSNSSFWQCPSAPWDPQSAVPAVPMPWDIAASPDREKIRAVGGKDGCSGRVEIWHRGTWGTLCDNAWDMRDAEVACRQLGCGPALYALGQAAAGEGTGPMWLMECRGTELSLGSSRTHNVGLRTLLTLPVLVFEGAAEVRLVDGGSRCAGRVEVKHQGQWGTVCSYRWDKSDAAVVCRQLGCGGALEAPRSAHFGPGSGPIWMDNVQCNGKESALSDCTHNGWGQAYCDHSFDAGVTCSGFRLVNGSTVCEGRVEVEVLGTWGTLCASRWDLSDAHVLCRHLGCGFAESIPGGGHFGRGTGPVWRDSFHCDGTEAHLGQCPVTALGASPCSQENAAAVICSGLTHPMPLRLVGGGSRCDGRVEVFQHGTWGRVLDEQWDMQEASVVCRQLQCGEAEAAYTPVRAKRGRGPVGLRGVRCAGHEADLSLCNTSLPQSTPAEGIMEEVGAVCRGEWCCTSPICGAGRAAIRLAEGAGRCAGRVEIYYQGRWGTVCDDAWDLADAAVVCRQLGCGGALEAAGSARFGEGSEQIWLDGVNCSGAEAALWDCPAEAWGQHDCGHKEDAGVVCSEFMALRLENSDGCSGRLQVFYNGTWGSVCSNSMTTETVSLVCKELGCGNEGDREILLNYVTSALGATHVHQQQSTAGLPAAPGGCRGNSRQGLRGDHAGAPPALLVPWDIAASPEREKIRAVGGKDGCSGRVEIWHRGTWGTLCDNAWDMRDAEVACRQLGCGPALYALGQAAAGEGTGPMWLMECRGTELSLQDCWAQAGDSAACHEGLPVPVIICIILGALLCLLLALLAGQVRSARARRRGGFFPSGPGGEMPPGRAGGAGGVGVLGHRNRAVCCLLPHVLPH